NEEEVAIDAIPLAVKSPKIIDWKIHKEENKSYYQIIRADGKSETYMVFNRMLKEFDREDLEELYNLVKSKYGSTRPVEDLDLLLWGDLETMFEPHVEDKVWKKQHGYKVLEWKLYNSCGVHSLRMQSVHIYMLVEKKYPFTAPTLASKRAGEELTQESAKKQKVGDDKETTELKKLMKIIPNEEEVAIDAIPLAVKSPKIIDWKIHKEGNKSYYQIIRADGKSETYMVFNRMLKEFDREPY
nr:hypothetical protein [Tanacetum cinerariifolium]